MECVSFWADARARLDVKNEKVKNQTDHTIDEVLFGASRPTRTHTSYTLLFLGLHLTLGSSSIYTHGERCR